MKLVLSFGEAYCYTTEFEINGIDAFYEDFGEKYDKDAGNAPEYGCGDMTFERNPDKKLSAKKKYKISEEEYQEICEKLEEGLSFGRCAWCS